MHEDNEDNQKIEYQENSVFDGSSDLNHTGIQNISKLVSQEHNQICPSHQTSQSGNSEVCMQEIMSPFRNLGNRQSNFTSNNSPNKFEGEHKRSGSGWQINPVKVKRDTSDGEFIQPEFILGKAFDDIVPEHSESCQSSSRTGSPCESPVKGAGHHQQYKISPGKLKTHITSTRQHIQSNIKQTELEILENSPSKHA